MELVKDVRLQKGWKSWGGWGGSHLVDWSLFKLFTSLVSSTGIQNRVTGWLDGNKRTWHTIQDTDDLLEGHSTWVPVTKDGGDIIVKRERMT